MEVERARVTRELAHIKKARGDLAGAADVLCELQVETFGSMDRNEKTGFILEQVQLCIERADFTQAMILSRKISIKFFGTEENRKNPVIMDMKLKYYEQQILLAKQEENYLDVCKHYRAVYDTPSISEDPIKKRQVRRAR